MITEDGQVVMTEGADVLLAGDGGVVLGRRVAEISGGRVVIDLDGAGQPGEPPAEDDGLAEFAAAERLAAIGWILTAPGAFVAAARCGTCRCWRLGGSAGGCGRPRTRTGCPATPSTAGSGTRGVMPAMVLL